MMDRKTLCFRRRHDHDVYYNPQTNTFVAHDPTHQDKGTCLRPTGGQGCFERQFERDVAYGGSPDRSRIREGGYRALYREHGRGRAPGVARRAGGCSGAV